MLKVGVFRGGEGAQDFYRALLPMQALERRKAALSRDIWMSNLLYEAGNRTKAFWEAMTSDIYLIQRISGQVLMKKIKEFTKELSLKSKIVIDHDDDVFSLSPLDNNYLQNGTEEAKIFHDGKLIFEWKDGVNIDIKANKKKQDETKYALEYADMVTVTTEGLAEVYRQYNGNVKVLPNCVDLTQWNRLDLTKKGQIHIAWAGGNGHFEDLRLIRKPLMEIAAKYPNVKISMLGYMPPTMSKDFREGQIKFERWTEMAAHPYRLAAMGIDIAVIPLRDNKFNHGKSPIKYIEFSALSIPSVVSLVTPYKELVDMTNNAVFVDNEEDAWFKGIETLILDEQLRRIVGSCARKYVEDHFDINTQCVLWEDAYKEVLCQSRQTQPLLA